MDDISRINNKNIINKILKKTKKHCIITKKKQNYLYYIDKNKNIYLKFNNLCLIYRAAARYSSGQSAGNPETERAPLGSASDYFPLMGRTAGGLKARVLLLYAYL